MVKLIQMFALAGILALPMTASAVVTVTSTTTDGNALRDAILGSGITTVGNATFVGSDVSAGFFEGGLSSIGIDKGILLTSGNANLANGPNVEDGATGFASNVGDADLNAAFGVGTTDTTYLEFEFTTSNNNLFFNFVFASEEYNEFTNSAFNDVFAFFLDGVNVALIPGTTDPVSINNVNGGNPLGTNATNPQFFNNNDLNDGGSYLNEVGYDGFTDVFTVQAFNLAPGTHKIKLAISDTADTVLDSGVFIQGDSFSVEPPPVEVIPEPASIVVWTLIGAVATGGYIRRRRQGC